jgi:hypothetical protein
MTRGLVRCVVFASALGICFYLSAAIWADDPAPARGDRYAVLRVIDAATGRGVPLVELETVNHQKFITDNAGRIAFREPELMDQEVFFTVRGHGYQAKKDGFGFAGAKLQPRAGKVSEIAVTRTNIAERLCRLTGQGRYRDTLLLGYPSPLAESRHPGRVAGQDSVQAAPHNGKLYWFWGDTSRMSYPLGLFRTAGATTPLPAAEFDPAAGIAFDYFVDKTGFAQAMMPLAERPQGVIWIDGVCTVPNDKGVETLIAHYSRRKGLAEQLEHGIAVFNDATAIFEPRKELPLDETWRFPHGHPEPFQEDGKRWLLFGSPALNVRVPATLDAVLDPTRYETFTCAKAGRDGKPSEPELDKNGKPVWRWHKDRSPVHSRTEYGWVKAGKIKPDDARFCPADVASPTDRVQLHNGTVRWNAFRKRWVLIAGQIGGKSSNLGEVWYAESMHPTGPFARAVHIVTHDRQSFYNVCHHAFLDQKDGRVIHFEGTYTSDFSGNPVKTPRYDYNQMLYRLDLDADSLRKARAE